VTRVRNSGLKNNHAREYGTSKGGDSNANL